MKHDFHPFCFNCDECKQKLDIREFSFCANGDILLQFFCENCKINGSYLTNGTKLILRAMDWDFQNQTRPNFPLKPPLKQIEKNNKKDDDDFLHNMGIEGI